MAYTSTAFNIKGRQLLIVALSASISRARFIIHTDSLFTFSMDLFDPTHL